MIKKDTIADDRNRVGNVLARGKGTGCRKKLKKSEERLICLNLVLKYKKYLTNKMFSR